MFLFPTLLSAQNCLYSKEEIDEFTNESKKITYPAGIGNTLAGHSLIVTFMNIAGKKYLGIKIAEDIGCLVTNRSYIIIKYKSGLTREMLHAGDIDCGNSANFITIITSEIATEFMDQELDKIRVSYESYKDITIHENRTFAFLEGIICIE